MPAAPRFVSTFPAGEYPPLPLAARAPRSPSMRPRKHSGGDDFKTLRILKKGNYPKGLHFARANVQNDFAIERRRGHGAQVFESSYHGNVREIFSGVLATRNPTGSLIRGNRQKQMDFGPL